MFIRKSQKEKTYATGRHHFRKGVVSALVLPLAILAVSAAFTYLLHDKNIEPKAPDIHSSVLSKVKDAFYGPDKPGSDQSTDQRGFANGNSDSPNGTGALVAARPKRIKIPAINVNAPIVNLGLNQNGTVQVPTNPFAVGWYSKSVTPGQQGASVMIGHLDSATGPAIFWNLKNLKTGDRIEVARADGTIAVFKVESSESVPQNSFPTQKVYGSTGQPVLRLITCAGTWLSSQHHYSNNLVIYASLVDQYAAK